MATISARERRARWVHRCRSLWAALLVYTGFLWVRRWMQGPRLLVLAYHRVTPMAASSQWENPRRYVSAETFEKQLLVLRRHYRFVSVDELRHMLAGEKSFRGHVALVTFDDGYRDNLEHALPILVRHGIPATFFLSLGFVGERRSFWFDRLAAACRGWEQGEPARARLRSLLPAPLAAILAARAAWPERLQRAVQFVARLPLLERRALLKRLLPEPAAAAQLASQALTWTEVRQLCDRGMSIGAHGMTHTPLTRLAAAEARRELEDSLDGVAQGSGTEVVAFAYPNGAADAEVVRLARDAGVQLGFTLAPRENRPGDDPLLLGRYDVCEDTSRSPSGDFSAALFLCTMAGMLRTPAVPETDTSRPGATLDLSWTGPQEASARREPLVTLPAARVWADPPPPRPARGPREERPAAVDSLREP